MISRVIKLWVVGRDEVNKVSFMTDDQIGTLSVHWEAVRNLQGSASSHLVTFKLITGWFEGGWGEKWWEKIKGLTAPSGAIWGQS